MQELNPEVVDCMGDVCPVPVIKTKKALASQGAHFSPLVIWVDNPISQENIAKFLDAKGYLYQLEAPVDGRYVILIKDVLNTETGAPTVLGENKGIDRKTVVVISSKYMGVGEDLALGETLMGGFIFALTQLEELPATLLLYNTGALLALEGAPTVADLQTLAKNGVDIRTCGLCLKHFNGIDRLAVGEVTDMYTIVSIMQQADHILRP